MIYDTYSYMGINISTIDYSTIIEWVIKAIILLAVVIALIKLGVDNIKTKSLSFSAKPKIKNNISLGNKIGFVVSIDSKIRKIHFKINISGKKRDVIDNMKVILNFNKKIHFVCKQFYKNNYKIMMRTPDSSITLPITLNNDIVELEPEFETNDYNNFEFNKGVYNGKFIVIINGKKIKKKFIIDISETKIEEFNKAKFIIDAEKKIHKAAVTSESARNPVVVQVSVIV